MPPKTIINEARVPIKIWSDKVEPEAIEQLKNTANLPFVFKQLSVMPDVHWGMGATVGSVVATRGAISPACVGVDIGCGMMAVKTNIDHHKVMEKLAEIRHSIERSIPVGHEGNRTIVPSVQEWIGWELSAKLTHQDRSLIDKARSQLGSLGGGNHFIEICLDTDNAVWIMLHSGSRNIGKTLAERHINTAKGLMKKFLIELPDEDLAYLPEKTSEFDAYLIDLFWCQQFAAQNREEMMSRILKDLGFAIGEFNTQERVNCHHNYVSREHHFGTNVLVTRKGAVRAKLGDMGIIPGSMGTRSYIVRGLGNPESFESCSHGAGRRMSRGKARKTFTVKDLETQTAGVECRKDEGVLDEIPGAYKDIDEVMANQSDLVEIVATLKQVMCVKG